MKAPRTVVAIGRTLAGAVAGGLVGSLAGRQLRLSVVRGLVKPSPALARTTPPELRDDAEPLEVPLEHDLFEGADPVDVLHRLRLERLQAADERKGERLERLRGLDERRKELADRLRELVDAGHCEGGCPHCEALLSYLVERELARLDGRIVHLDSSTVGEAASHAPSPCSTTVEAPVGASEGSCRRTDGAGVAP